jgi:hypothetical protein
VLQQSREQSAHLLQSVTATIEQKIGEVRAEFQQHAAAELHSLEQRAHSLAENIGGQVKQDISADLQNFQRQVSIAAARFDEKSGEMGRELQARLSAQHDEQKREMREAHLAAAAESSRVQERISALDDKVSKLHEAASRLELDLNAALTRTANDIVAQARGQLESAVDSMLRDLTQRNSAQVEMQLEQAGSRLKKMLAEAESSSSAVVKKEISENLQSFEQTVEEMAQHSVSRWRLALAGELESLSKLLSGQLRVEKNPEYDEERAADA